MKRVFIAVDVSNLYFCAKNVRGGLVDFDYLLSYILKDRELFKAVAYGACTPDNQKFVAKLQYSGFETKFKEPKFFADGSKKADWDVGITVDLLRMIDRYDVIALCTGDGDFAPALEYAKSRGVEVEVYGINISSDLRDIAKCTDLQGRFIRTFEDMKNETNNPPAAEHVPSVIPGDVARPNN